MKDEIERLFEENERLRLKPQIPESAIRAVWEHGNSQYRGSSYDDYAHRVGAIVVEELKRWVGK